MSQRRRTAPYGTDLAREVIGQQRPRPGDWLKRPGRRSRVRGVRFEVEEGSHDRHGCRPVRHAVMQLQQYAHATVTEAGQEPELPERAIAVELAFVESGGRFQELGIVARGPNRGLADVVANVEPIVVDPQRAASQDSGGVETTTQFRNACQAAM